MVPKNKMIRVMLILFALLSIAMMGCSGGGDSDTPAATPTPSLTVLPADFQFATLTGDNTAEPLEVTLRNDGTADLVVSDIALAGTDVDQFRLDVNVGTNPCASTTPTIASTGSCNVTVYFEPQSIGTFSADLTIASNDADSPYDLALQGTKEEINSITVKINQIDACPRNAATAYVSVTDQGGFQVTGLTTADFTLSEDGGTTDIAPTAFGYIYTETTATISIALVMDYSGSITDEPDNVTDMENAAINFVNQLDANDEAEIIKYGSTIEVTQGLTSDKALLIAKIQSTPSVGEHTALYDAVVKAAQDIAVSTKQRQAIIIITDGMDDDGTGAPQSTSDLNGAIAEANADGIPVFTIGLGNADVTVLEQLADDTGGTYSESATSDNLATIYQQLADLLFTNQYILTYASGIAIDATGTLTVTATSAPGISATDTIAVPACP
jgi:VWFA-related protein